jgi:hypothetical protein
MPNTGKSARWLDYAVFTPMPCFAEGLVAGSQQPAEE